ncbi:MAG: cupin domain-containing protein [Caldilineaceae bacterium]|nr:cupin domain-containing protein [Caldilineaceae bacterium]
MGGQLEHVGGQAIQLCADVFGGSGLALHIIADGAVVRRIQIDDDPMQVQLSVEASRYLRAEVVGDMARGKAAEKLACGA